MVWTGNLDAFTSFGHEQGDNAPISEQAAFAYSTALSAFLAQGSRNRIQIGDASTVFWADGSDATESDFAMWFGGEDEASLDDADARRIGAILDAIRKGRPTNFAPELATACGSHVLGLSECRAAVRAVLAGR